MSNEGKRLWFDDPEWHDLRNRINNGKVQPSAQITPISVARPVPATKQPPRKVEISLKLQMPKPNLGGLKKLPALIASKLRYFRLHRIDKRLVISGLAAVVLLAGAVPYLVRTGSGPSDNLPVEGALGDSDRSPTYEPVLPKNNKVTTGYDPEKAVVSYQDTISGVNITVSQQPLPASFKADTDKQVENVAKGFSATEKIAAGGTTAYLGTSTKGPQSVIFHKNELLIFIQSATKIENSDWSKYIENLNQ